MLISTTLYTSFIFNVVKLHLIKSPGIKFIPIALQVNVNDGCPLDFFNYNLAYFPAVCLSNIPGNVKFASKTLLLSSVKY